MRGFRGLNHKRSGTERGYKSVGIEAHLSPSQVRDLAETWNYPRGRKGMAKDIPWIGGCEADGRHIGLMTSGFVPAKTSAADVVSIGHNPLNPVPSQKPICARPPLMQRHPNTIDRKSNGRGRRTYQAGRTPEQRPKQAEDHHGRAKQYRRRRFTNPDKAESAAKSRRTRRPKTKSRSPPMEPPADTWSTTNSSGDPRRRSPDSSTHPPPL